MRHIFLLLVFILSSGCCYFAKRDCFPPCPPKEVIVLSERCKLPAKLKMEDIFIEEEGCPKDFICFDKENYTKLANRLYEMGLWIEYVSIRCGDIIQLSDSDAGIVSPDAGINDAVNLNDASLD